MKIPKGYASDRPPSYVNLVRTKADWRSGKSDALDRARDLYEAHYVDKLSKPEIARSVGASASTVNDYIELWEHRLNVLRTKEAQRPRSERGEAD